MKKIPLTMTPGELIDLASGKTKQFTFSTMETQIVLECTTAGTLHPEDHIRAAKTAGQVFGAMRHAQVMVRTEL